MIFVTGVTGTIGQELCKLLLEASVPFRAMCRGEEPARKLSAQGAQVVRGDFGDAESLRQAMPGCDRLFLLAPGVPEQEEWQRRAIDIALESGIQHVTRISAADSNLGTKVPWARAHAVGDHDLRSRAIRWTILRPTGFMQNALWFAPAISHGVFPYVTGEGRVSYIDARDIAAVAKRVLTEEGHDGATYFLTGPEALAAVDIAAGLSASLDHSVEPVHLTEEDMVQRLRSAGLSEWNVAGLMAQYAVIAGGLAVDVTEEVRRLTGRAPLTFLDFAHDARAALAHRSGQRSI
jgi:uncharacterized protein YbjT (DUF2867 family)